MEEKEYIEMDAIESAHWWFIAKRQFLLFALKRWKKDTHGLYSLDVGCGTGAVMNMLKEKGFDVAGVDMSPLAISFSEKKGLSPVLGDATALPFDDNYFDVVTALDVVEHVENDSAAVKEMYRVLKPGGIAVISVPAHMWLWSYHDVSLHHFRRYGYKEFRSLVQETGTTPYVSPIHMTILPIVTSVRMIRKLLGKTQHASDVKETHPLITHVFGVVYAIERTLLRLFGRLPFGTSYIAVIEKPS